MKPVMGIEEYFAVTLEDSRKWKVEMDRMLAFQNIHRAMQLLLRLDPDLFKQREKIHRQREIILSKIYAMQAKDNSLSPAKCWFWLRKEQPNLFARLPEILTTDATIIEC